MSEADSTHDAGLSPFGPPLTGAEIRVFKQIGEAQLRLHIFAPEGHQAADRRAAIVFFFGGGWTGGTPAQFHLHSLYLASRGMVAICAEYRVQSKHGTTPFESVADGRSAVRWIRAHATELGIDPDRIAAGGGSAGGHVAACTGTLPHLDEPDEDQSISSVPNALVLFNPVADTTETGWTGAAERLGERARELSPCHHVTNDTPPAIIFHGTADVTVPIENVERLRDRMQELGRECRLVAFEGKPHGFFNYGRDDKAPYVETVRAMDEFLTSLDFLTGEPTIR